MGIRKQVEKYAQRIYKTHLPPYLQDSWHSGRGKWYEEWLREQLDTLILSEIEDDPCRLNELKRIESEVSLVFGIFGTAFRILDHFGMHLRAQTLGQYELWQEDEKLLHKLCRKFLHAKDSKTIATDYFKYLCQVIELEGKTTNA